MIVHHHYALTGHDSFVSQVEDEGLRSFFPLSKPSRETAKVLLSTKQDEEHKSACLLLGDTVNAPITTRIQTEE